MAARDGAGGSSGWRRTRTKRVDGGAAASTQRSPGSRSACRACCSDARRARPAKTCLRALQLSHLRVGRCRGAAPAPTYESIAYIDYFSQLQPRLRRLPGPLAACSGLLPHSCRALHAAKLLKGPLYELKRGDMEAFMLAGSSARLAAAPPVTAAGALHLSCLRPACVHIPSPFSVHSTHEGAGTQPQAAPA